MKNRTIVQRLFDEIKSLFLGGLFTLLPIALTIAFFAFTLKLIKSWFNPIYLVMPTCLQTVPYSEIVLVIATIFAVGAVLKFFLLQPLVDAIEKYFLGKLPLIRTVYFGIKQLVRAFSPQDTEHFQKVVLIEFPRAGVYSIGFLTGAIPEELCPEETKTPTCKSYYSVFIPNTPNPTTGYYIIAAESDCKATTLTRQEAMTIIISGGIIKPDRFNNRKS